MRWKTITVPVDGGVIHRVAMSVLGATQPIQDVELQLPNRVWTTWVGRRFAGPRPNWSLCPAGSALLLKASTPAPPLAH